MSTQLRRPWLLVLLFAALFLVTVLPVQAQGGTSPRTGPRFQAILDLLAANNIPPGVIQNLAATSSNPQAMAAELAQAGLTPQQIQAFMTPQNVLLLSTIGGPTPATDLITQASAVLANYNINPAELTNLLPLANDPAALMAALAQRGLTNAQVAGLVGQLAPVIQQANESGVLRFAPTLIADQMLSQIGICGGVITETNPSCDAVVREIGPFLNDPARLAEYLRERGLTAQQVQAGVQAISGLAQQGLSPDLYTEWNIRTATLRLQELGISPRDLNELAALGNMTAMRERLEEMGFSGAALELAAAQLQGAFGPGDNFERLTPERITEFQADEAARLLEEAGIDPADLGDILALMDDPEALAEYLADYGLDDDAAEAFIQALSRSTFAQTVDPEDADDFLASVEDAWQALGEEGQEDTGNEVEVEQPTDTGGDTGGDEGDTGSDEGDTGGGEDTGGGGEDTGDGEGEG